MSACASSGLLAGAALGLFVGGWGLAIVLAVDGGGDVGWIIGLFVVLPICVLGGAWLGTRLFLRFRAFANGLRQRHHRVGALAWIGGSTLLVLAGALAAIFIAAILWSVFH